MMRKAFKTGLVLLALSGLTGCTEDNQQRVEQALTQAGQAMEMLGDSASELAEVAWLESQLLWQSGESLVREQQQALDSWRSPVTPPSRYAEMETTRGRPLTGAPGEGPTQEHNNKEEPHRP